MKMPKPTEPLKQLNGASIASGIAIGPAFVLARDVLSVPKRTITPEEVEGERARLATAAVLCYLKKEWISRSLTWIFTASQKISPS